MNYEVNWFHKETKELQSQDCATIKNAVSILNAVIRDGHFGMWLCPK